MDTEIRKEWRGRAHLFQQAMFVRLGGRKWDAIPAHNRTLLQRKVGFALFGAPTILPTVGTGDQEGSSTGYTEDQLEIINKYCDMLYRLAYKIHGCIYVSCVFIVAMFEHRLIPVFKVLHKRNQTRFLIKRWQSEEIAVYTSWEMLEARYLSRISALFCFPKHGTYSDRGNGQVNLWYIPIPGFTVKVTAEYTLSQSAEAEQASDFQLSPPHRQQQSEASSESSDSEAPHGAVDCEAPAEAVDCEEMKTLNLDEVLNSHSSQVTCPSIEDAAELLPSDSSALQPVDVAAANLAFSLVGNNADGQNNNKNVSLAGLLALRDVVKLAQNATFSDLQCFQFCSSFLFYTNRLVDPDTVKRVVEDAQTELIESHEKSLTVDQRAEYDKLARPLRGQGSLHDKAKLVRQVIHIWDKDLFYDSLLEIGLDSKEHEVGFSESVPGLINIDNAITLHPLKLSFLSPVDMEEFLNVCLRLKTSPTVGRTEFRKEIQKICNKNRLYFDFLLEETKEKLNKLARDMFDESEFQNLEVNDTKIFANMEPHEVNRLGQTLRRDECNYDPKLVQITMKLANKQCIERPQHFWCLLEFVINYMQERMRNANDVYNESRNRAMTDPEFLKPDGRFDMGKFNANYGVSGRIKEFCRERALDEMGTDVSIKEMNENFSQVKASSQALNEQLEIGFADEYAAAYHYLKHRKWKDDEELSVERYFLIVKGLVQAFPKYFKGAGVSQYGDYIYIEYSDPSSEAFGVTYHWININCPKEIVATVFKASNKVKIK